MTSLEKLPVFDSTSAAGAMRVRQVREPVLVGCMLAGLGTSTAFALPQHVLWRSQRSMEQTTAGAMVRMEQPAGANEAPGHRHPEDDGAATGPQGAREGATAQPAADARGVAWFAADPARVPSA